MFCCSVQLTSPQCIPNNKYQKQRYRKVNAWELFLHLILEEVIVKEWLAQNGCISLSNDGQWLTKGERSAAEFQLAKKRVQTWSMIAFVSPVSSSNRSGWNVSLKGSVVEARQCWTFRSHGLLREAATKEKVSKLVCFTGWVVRGRWETVNIKFCLRSTGWNIFSLQDRRRIRPAKGFPAFVGLEGRRWLLGSQSTWSAHEETETQHAVDKVSIYSLHIQDLGILFVCSTGAVYSSLWALISDIFWCSQWWNVLWHPWQETQPFCKWKSVMF